MVLALSASFVSMQYLIPRRARVLLLCCLDRACMSSLNTSFDTQLEGYLSLPKSEATYDPELGIAQKNNKESSADDLKLQMVGQTKTTAIYYVGTGDNRQRRTANETKEFISYDVQLASFGGKAASGVHTFPFSITLPAGLPPSLKVW